nr:MAG: capsid protein [Avian astrovirus 4]
MDGWTKIEMEAPKPQRVRKNRRQKTAKVEVDVKVKDREKKPKRPRTVEHVIETAAGSRQMRFTNATARQLRSLQKRVAKLSKADEGAKIQDLMETTVTIGVVRGITENGLKKQFRTWLSPLLMKPSDSHMGATPLSIRASQYNLWKIQQAEVILKPLVGRSVVGGSVLLMDLDQEASSAKPDTIDSIKARPYKEVQIGSLCRWRLPRRQLEGPRQGWWLVDTNEQPSLSLGPAVNFSVYLKTVNMLSIKGKLDGNGTETSDFTAPLALIELRMRYAFANYNPKPALSQLVRRELHHGTNDEAKIKNGEDGEVILQVTTNSMWYDIMHEVEYVDTKAGTSGVSKKGSTFWTIGSDVVDTVAPALGPWGWLLKGGWWVVRQIFDTAKAAQGTKTVNYAIYASIEDAARDIPIRTPVNMASTAGGTAGEITLPAGRYQIQQITSDNLESPVATTIPAPAGIVRYGEDYLPCEKSVGQKTPLDLAYQVDVDGTYKAGWPGVYLPDYGQGANVAANWLIIGTGVFSYANKSIPNTQGGEVVGLNVISLGTRKKRINLTTRGEYLCWFVFESVSVLGFQDLRKYGLVHDRASLCQAAQRALDNIGRRDEGAPSQLALYLDSWNVTTNSQWPNFLRDSHYGIWGVRPLVIPVKLGLPGTVVSARFLTHTETEWNPIAQSQADAMMFVSPDIKQVGLLFSTHNNPETYNQKLIFATNCTTDSDWNQRWPMFTYEKFTYNPESDIEIVEEDWDSRKRKKP